MVGPEHSLSISFALLVCECGMAPSLSLRVADPNVPVFVCVGRHPLSLYLRVCVYVYVDFRVCVCVCACACVWVWAQSTLSVCGWVGRARGLSRSHSRMFFLFSWISLGGRSRAVSLFIWARPHTQTNRESLGPAHAHAQNTEREAALGPPSHTQAQRARSISLGQPLHINSNRDSVRERERRK